MEWTSQNITWFIDGKQTFKVATPADMHQPMYVLLNLAVGGNWPGTPDASVDWSKADLLVDYVRAYSLNSTTTPPSSPTPSSPATTLLAVSQGTDPFDTTTRVDLEIGAANTGRVYRIDDGQGGTADVAVVFDAQRDLYLANRGDWNAVKNALVFDTPGRGVEVRNFVNVQIGTGDADDVVKVAGAKRGSISTGAGDDDVSITGFSSGTTSNVMNVLGGSDDDTIDFDGGGFNVARLDGGSGNDELQIAGGARGTLIGGTGDDRLVDVSTGAVTISGGGGADDFVFGRDANATVTDFAAGVDQVTLIGVSSAEVGVTLAGADTLLDLGGGSVRLTGINLSRAELDLHFV
jgi:hypothetical protein